MGNFVVNAKRRVIKNSNKSIKKKESKTLKFFRGVIKNTNSNYPKLSNTELKLSEKRKRKETSHSNEGSFPSRQGVLYMFVRVVEMHSPELGEKLYIK